MSANNHNNGFKSYENDHNTCTTGIIKEDKCAISELSLKFLQLVSIFEGEDSDKKQKFLSQRQLTAEAETEVASPTSDVPASEEIDSTNNGGGTTSASGVAVMNYVGGDGGGGDWIMRKPERNLLIIVHPWCMLRKSGADRQSEFPPPGFLQSLKAKLLALHRKTAEEQRHCNHPSMTATTVRRRRHTNQNKMVGCWFQYTAAAAAISGPRAKTITGSGAVPIHHDEPRAVDFLTAKQRFATVATKLDKTNTSSSRSRSGK
ncbi:Hypothetical protein CINCED_3A000126 [Cinara cedri]|uniref:Uncharacterized protein n=1 Tax=Cinara cedri TaxID=506608 RepID=A0A5E4MKA5_9HEMI|nr:Hypothetical protein CINCED_3A000126 [Cinara cedri]